ncbi:hypothetical protein ACLOJK_009327 [Asimina triloba]
MEGANRCLPSFLEAGGRRIEICTEGDNSFVRSEAWNLRPEMPSALVLLRKGLEERDDEAMRGRRRLP